MSGDQLVVKVFYCGKQVIERKAIGANGCRIFYGSPPPAGLLTEFNEMVRTMHMHEGHCDDRPITTLVIQRSTCKICEQRKCCYDFYDFFCLFAVFLLVEMCTSLVGHPHRASDTRILDVSLTRLLQNR